MPATMNAGSTAERVYSAIKHGLVAGHYAPGMRLETARMAADLASSTTPVRDALNRLAGEGLVDMRQSDGFHVRLMSEAGLRDLYRWNDELVRASLRTVRSALARSDGRADPDDAAGVFVLIASLSRSPEIVRQMAAANDRLGIARRTEFQVLENPEQDVLEILAATRRDISHAKRLLTSYHRLRIRRASDIISAMNPHI